MEAQAAAVLTGFTTAAEFDAVQRSLFVDALVRSVPMIKHPSNVNITSATLVGRRRRRQLLAAPTLAVKYTLTVTAAGATSVEEVATALSAQLVATFSEPGGGGESPFATALTKAAEAQGLDASAVRVKVDALATTALVSVSALTVTVTKQHTIRPTRAPTPQPQPQPPAKKSARSFVGDPAFYFAAAAAPVAMLFAYLAWRTWLRPKLKVVPVLLGDEKGAAVAVSPAPPAAREELPPLRLPANLAAESRAAQLDQGAQESQGPRAGQGLSSPQRPPQRAMI